MTKLELQMEIQLLRKQSIADHRKVGVYAGLAVVGWCLAVLLMTQVPV